MVSSLDEIVNDVMVEDCNSEDVGRDDELMTFHDKKGHHLISYKDSLHLEVEEYDDIWDFDN